MHLFAMIMASLLQMANADGMLQVRMKHLAPNVHRYLLVFEDCSFVKVNPQRGAGTTRRSLAFESTVAGFRTG